MTAYLFSSTLGDLYGYLATMKTSSYFRDRRELFGLCTGVMLASAAFSMSAPLVPLQVTALGAAPSLLGVLISVTAIGSLLVAVPSGVLIQRFGARALIAVACCLVTVSCLLICSIPVIGVFFIGLTFFEIGRVIIAVGTQGHTANLSSGRNPGLYFGWYGSAASIGQMLGPYAAGLLIDTLGYRLTWAGIGVLMLLTGLVLIILIKPGQFGSDNAQKSHYSLGQMKRLLNIPAVVAILVSFIVVFATGARTIFFPLYVNGLRYSASAIGAIMSLRALASVSSRLLMRRFLLVCGGRIPTLLVSITALSIGVGLTPFCRGLAGLIFVSILVGIGTGLAHPLSMATVADGVKPEDRGVALGVRLTGTRLAKLINPLFFGLITQGFGISMAFWAGGIILIGAIVPVFIWWRKGRLALVTRYNGNTDPQR